MADTVTWFFRFLHILSGVAWVGGTFLWGMVIAPRIMQKGPPAIRRPFLEAALKPISNFLTIAGAATILTGLIVMGIIVSPGGMLDTFQGTGYGGAAYGWALGVGFVASLVMMVEGFAIIRPTAFRLLAEMQKMPPGPPTGPPPEIIPRLGKKLGIASMTTLLLGTIALGAMAWAVNAVR